MFRLAFPACWSRIWAAVRPWRAVGRREHQSVSLVGTSTQPRLHLVLCAEDLVVVSVLAAAAQLSKRFQVDALTPGSHARAASCALHPCLSQHLAPSNLTRHAVVLLGQLSLWNSSRRNVAACRLLFAVRAILLPRLNQTPTRPSLRATEPNPCAFSLLCPPQAAPSARRSLENPTNVSCPALAPMSREAEPAVV